MAAPAWFKRILAHYGVPYAEHHHLPVQSASRLARVVGLSGYQVAKTVVLAGPQGPVTIVLPACVRLDPARVQRVLGDEVRLATQEEIHGWFPPCRPGAVPPLRLRHDQAIVMDRSLARLGEIAFTAGTYEDSVKVRFRDWYGMVRPGVGRFAEPPNGQPDGKTSAFILIVEDEPVTNDALCQLLQREGFECRGVGDGRHAVVLATETRPSAILLDLMLPDMSGLEVYERLRRTGPLKRTPVIVVTAVDSAAARQRGWELGADAYLVKPVNLEALVAELRDILGENPA
jgi:CheY-like chemotaxis protein/prolyl-tRNA editing enzyme YbaK/EbsC (Cys-tRNA(Pro) deacylase)